MEEQSFKVWNWLFIILAIITFILSWKPDIQEQYKIMLLISSIILIIIIYFSPYFKITDKIKDKIKELENKIDNVENLINMQSDIKLLKRKVFGNE